MKIAPILRVIHAKYKDQIQPVLVHTGQHYDENMSDAFFDDLGISKPDYNLEVGSGSHAQQTAAIMTAFEEVCASEKPDMVLVVGDVNSTIATGLVAKKMDTTLIHVEAGLRSGDRTMPEEINRLTTDAITDLFFTTEQGAEKNILHEGHDKASVHFVGHVMIDNLFYQLDKLKEQGPNKNIEIIKSRLPEKYACMTLHRPSNVDNRKDLNSVVKGLKKVAEQLPVVFPCHPRTEAKLKEFGLWDAFLSPEHAEESLDSGLILLPPLGYNNFLYLWKDAVVVLTDSGGLQEETTALNIPCLTLRENTERPVTVEVGSNELVGRDMLRVEEAVTEILKGEAQQSQVPKLWDGRASERIMEIITKYQP